MGEKKEEIAKDEEINWEKVTGAFVEDMSLSTVSTINAFRSTQYQKAEDLSIYDKMKLAGSYFTTDNIVQNCFTSQVSMAFNSLEHKTVKDPTNLYKDFYDYLARRLNLRALCRMFYLCSLVYSNVYMLQFWEEVEVPWGAKAKKVLTIPTEITLVDPRYGRVLGSTLKYNRKIGMRISREAYNDYTAENLNELNEQYAKDIFIGKYDYKNKYNYRKDNGLEYGDEVLEFNPEVTSHFKFRGQDFNRYATPIMANCFDWIQRKKKLMEADMAVIDGIINMIYLFTIGTDDHPAKGKGELNKLASLIQNTSRTCTLVWNHRLKVSVISPDADSLLNTDKYHVCNDNIREGLGFEFKNTMSRGRRDIDKLIKIFCEVILSDRQDIVEHIEKNIYEKVAEENNFYTSASMKPNRIGLATDDLLKAFVGLFYDRGLPSKRTTMEIMGLDYDEEKELKIPEKKDVEEGIWDIPQLPFSRPQTGGGKEQSQADFIPIDMSVDNYLDIINSEVKKPEVHQVIKEKLQDRLGDYFSEEAQNDEDLDKLVKDTAKKYEKKKKRDK